MDTIKETKETQTTVVESPVVELSTKYNISAPLFIMFAEYLGYVGKTLEWVDKWCTEKVVPEEYKRKFIETEAKTVLNEAKKKFSIKQLREYYDEIYEVILYMYNDNLKELDAKKLVL